jgi:hypothetical protein
MFVFVCIKETNKKIPKLLYKTSILVYNIDVHFKIHKKEIDYE